jgi:hypothetical protein
MRALLAHAQRAIPMLQVDMARLLGISTRTMRRWMSRSMLLAPSQLLTLTRVVHVKDPPLAARIAAAHGQTLESLGVVVPPPPPPPPAPPPPPPPPPPVRDLRAEQRLADALVCAAAEVADLSPRLMRPALAAAFARAHDAGLTLEAALALFAPQDSPKPAQAAESKG